MNQILTCLLQSELWINEEGELKATDTVCVRVCVYICVPCVDVSDPLIGIWPHTWSRMSENCHSLLSSTRLSHVMSRIHFAALGGQAFRSSEAPPGWHQDNRSHEELPCSYYENRILNFAPECRRFDNFLVIFLLLISFFIFLIDCMLMSSMLTTAQFLLYTAYYFF